MKESGRSWPRWMAIAVSLLIVALGVAMLFKPYASLAALVVVFAAGAVLLGIGDLLDFRSNPSDRRELVTGLLWIALAVAVLVFSGDTIRILAALAGFGLIASGLLRIRSGWRDLADQRYTAILLGAASVILGLLALGWPDLTILAMSIFFGLWLIVSGLVRLWRLFRTEPSHHTESASGWRRWSRLAVAAGALVIALGLLAASAFLRGGEPTVDAFYDAPDDVPGDPGVLVRQEPFTRDIPEGAVAWRILYTTTTVDGEPAVASAIVVARENLPEGPRPVIAWAHGTTGFAERCAPSVLDDPFTSGAMPDLGPLIENGWVLVATDYIGLGTKGPHPYLIVEGEGRSVLDAIRAVHQVEEIETADTTIVWGHSQGGQAALSTALLQPDYAPEIDISGVAAMAPASNLTGMVDNLGNLPDHGAILGSFVIAAYSEIYDDVSFDAYVRPGARTLMRELASRCLAEPEMFVSVVETLLLGQSPWSEHPNDGPLGERLQENVPAGSFAAPILLAQGLADTLVIPAAQEAFNEQLCELGNQVDYRTYEGYDHVGVVSGDSPLLTDLITWTQERIDGLPPESTC
ncbi:MAG: DUF308 domain-containing protein [Thermomicrobiales bacterium]|nr:DUF308 domain-containing protein [Thermomicrobiales bacterium]